MRIHYWNEDSNGNESDVFNTEFELNEYTEELDRDLGLSQLNKFSYWSIEVLKTNIEWIQVFRNKTNSDPSKESVLSVTLNGTNTITTGDTLPEISENEFIELLDVEDRRVYQFNTLGV